MSDLSILVSTHGVSMTLADLYDLVRFLRKVYPGKADEERLVQLIDKLEHEIGRRKKK